MHDVLHSFLVPACWLAFWMLAPWGLWRRRGRMRRRDLRAAHGRMCAAPPPPDPAQSAELLALRERVKVLERIVVDGETSERRHAAALAAEIEQLR